MTFSRRAVKSWCLVMMPAVRVKEKRIAACDMAAMAASCDDNKFLIVAEGG